MFVPTQQIFFRLGKSEKGKKSSSKKLKALTWRSESQSLGYEILYGYENLYKKWDFCTCTTLTEILIQENRGWAQSFALSTRTEGYFDASAPNPHLEKLEVVLHIEVEAVIGDSRDNSLSPPFLHQSLTQVTGIEKRFLCTYPKPCSWKRREKEQYFPGWAAH